MTSRDPSAVALPDTPELPADVEDEIRRLEDFIADELPKRPLLRLGFLRSVIAKHLLTAEESGLLLMAAELGVGPGQWAIDAQQKSFDRACEKLRSWEA